MACRNQLRVAPGAVLGLDYGAVMAFAAATGADPQMVAESLPEIELMLIDQYADGGSDLDDEEMDRGD